VAIKSSSYHERREEVLKAMIKKDRTRWLGNPNAYDVSHNEATAEMLDEIHTMLRELLKRSEQPRTRRSK
jgi:hypothetical protein